MAEMSPSEIPHQKETALSFLDTGLHSDMETSSLEGVALYREAQESGRRMQSRAHANLCAVAWLRFPSLLVGFCSLQMQILCISHVHNDCALGVLYKQTNKQEMHD